MIGFWIAAVGLLLVALSFLLVPLWHQRQQSETWSVAGLVAAVTLVPVTVGVYLSVSTWQPDPTSNRNASTTVPAVAEMVDTLAERMQANPEDVTGWLMLGRSYVELGRYIEALEAFREAWDRTSLPGVDLKVAIAEAQALADPASLSGAAGQLFDEVLAEDPSNQKALWYGGLAALQTGEREVVRQRWSALLAIGVPPEVDEIIRGQLAEFNLTPVSTESARVDPPAAADDSQFALQLTVSLDDSMGLPDFGPGAALFIFARAPEGGPPPCCDSGVGRSNSG